MKTVFEAREAYRQSAVSGVSSIGLVVLLFNSALEDMRRALGAMQQTDVEGQVAAIRHALLILQQLQGNLDFDQGGEAARQFEQFYNAVRAKLLEAQIRHSPDLLNRQIQFMAEVRDCWRDAEHQIGPAPVAESPEPSRVASGWSA
jgi:flagellar protein FliS